MIFEQSWRWYGPQDPIELDTVKQAGAHGVVTALHEIPVGEVWSVEAINERIALLDASNVEKPFRLHWNVVESLPVHEHIKQGRPERDKLIENYISSLQNLAICGIKIICYNFMPVLDWLRTDVDHPLEDGSTALRFDPVELAMFDLFILERKDAATIYPEEVASRAEAKYATLDAAAREKLKASLLMALPGDAQGFTLENLQNGLDNYAAISAEDLKENLVYFLKKVIPAAEKAGVNLAIHPDDPPFSVFGLPRVVSTAADLEFIFGQVPSRNNGLTFCSGSLGASQENDLVQLLERWHERIHFVHLRSVHHEDDGSFYEANHLEGHADLARLIQVFYMLDQRNKTRTLPMRADHGHRMLGDLNHKFYPGYSAIGRLRSLAELRGLELGIIKSLEDRG